MQAQTVYIRARSHGSPDEEEEFNMKKKKKVHINCIHLFYKIYTYSQFLTM